MIWTILSGLILILIVGFIGIKWYFLHRRKQARLARSRDTLKKYQRTYSTKPTKK